MRRLFVALTLFLVAATARLSAQQQEVHFPFPTIPDTLTAPRERLSFLLERYWSLYRFSDATEHNRQVAEQGFADYVNLLHHADSALAARSVAVLIDSLAADGHRASMFEGLTDHYLANPHSPLRDDVVYAHMLRGLCSLPSLGASVRSRLAFRLALVERNQPGTAATDFEFVDRAGHCHRLYDVESPLTLVVFSDPECDHCKEAMPAIVGCEALLTDRRLRVLVVCPDDNAEAWRREAHTLPRGWTDAISKDGQVAHEQLYHLPALPSLYLLDRDKRVVVKDGTLTQIVSALGVQTP